MARVVSEGPHTKVDLSQCQQCRHYFHYHSGPIDVLVGNPEEDVEEEAHDRKHYQPLPEHLELLRLQQVQGIFF